VNEIRELLIEEMRHRIGDAARREEIAQLGVQIATMAGRQLAGEDVTADMRHLQAQALLIASAEASAITNALHRAFALAVSTLVAAIPKL
jgi:hypothetical protein